MGSFISKQPNGLYCRFSTVVDCPTNWNMTVEDYIALKVQDAIKEAIDVLENYIQPFDYEICLQNRLRVQARIPERMQRLYADVLNKNTALQ